MDPTTTGSQLHIRDWLEYFPSTQKPLSLFCSTANVTLLPLERTVSRDDIECPGDTIPYMCSVQSNSENIMLMWLVTFPGQAPISVTYTNFSAAETLDILGMNVTTVVIDDERRDFIVSVATITVLPNVSMNGTLVECSGEDLDREVATVYVNTSGMQLKGWRVSLCLDF